MKFSISYTKREDVEEGFIPSFKIFCVAMDTL